MRLALRKQLVEEIADSFDGVYQTLAPKQLMLFQDSLTQSRYPQVVFSQSALLIGCGVLRLHTLRCGSDVVERTTRIQPGCTLLRSGDVRIPLPMCDRVWQLRTVSGGSKPCTDCTVCGCIQARHAEAMYALERELEQAQRYVAIAVYFQMPDSAKSFGAFERREMFSDCSQLAIKHACGLLLDTRDRVGWLVESQCLLPFAHSRIKELVEDTLGMRMAVHPLASQHECTERGSFKYKWCLLYSQSMTLALVDATASTTEEEYLRNVWQTMYDFMQRRVRQASNLEDGRQLVARLAALSAA